MKLKSLEPIAELDICQVIYFTTQKLVTYKKSLDKNEQENLLIAKYSDGKSYVLHNFGSQALRARNAKKHLSNLLSTICGLQGRSTVDVSSQHETNSQ